MPYSPEVTAFWKGYQSLVESVRPSLGADYVKLFYKGENKPEGSISLYFRPWVAHQPYIGYQTNMGRVVLYITNEVQIDTLESYLKATTDPLGEEYYTEKTSVDTMELYIKIPSIDISKGTFKDWEDVATLSYEKVVKLYKLVNKVFPGLPCR